jgi:hypothetical protein
LALGINCMSLTASCMKLAPLRSGRNIRAYCAIRHLKHFFSFRSGNYSCSLRYTNRGRIIKTIHALTRTTRKL